MLKAREECPAESFLPISPDYAEQNKAEKTASQPCELDGSWTFFLPYEPASQNHPDRGGPKDHGCRSRRYCFLSLGQKAAGNENHIDGKNERVPEVLQSGDIAFSAHPDQGKENDARQQHADAYEQKGREARQSEFYAYEAGTPGQINEDQANDGLYDVFGWRTQHDASDPCRSGWMKTER